MELIEFKTSPDSLFTDINRDIMNHYAEKKESCTRFTQDYIRYLKRIGAVSRYDKQGCIVSSLHKEGFVWKRNMTEGKRTWIITSRVRASIKKWIPSRSISIWIAVGITLVVLLIIWIFKTIDINESSAFKENLLYILAEKALS